MKITRPLVTLDIETTGRWVEKDKIVEIAMIRLDPDGSREVYEKRVNPLIPIPPEVTRIINITDEDIKAAPHFKDIAAEVLSFLGDADLAGFNIERFDLPVIEREIFEAGLRFDWKGRSIYDVQKIYHVNEKRDLMAAYQFYCNKELKNAHSAMGDAQATLEIVDMQVQKYGMGAEDIESLKEFDYEFPTEFFDKDRRFRWWNGQLYPMFGKHARRQSMEKIARTDRPYLEWILNQDFSDQVKSMVRELLKGIPPKP